MWNRIDKEPSGHTFDSIVQLEYEKGRPRNPFINAGAIVLTDAILAGSTPAETLGEILRFVRAVADDEGIYINEQVAKSENTTGHRNYALANFMRSYGNLHHPVEVNCCENIFDKRFRKIDAEFTRIVPCQSSF